jgi:hypothetical protein
MPVSIIGNSGIQFPDSSLQAAAASPYVLKNRIINGDMRIDQRNAGASVSTASGSSAYTLDRWQIIYDATSKFTLQQNAGSVTPPVGFSNYLGITSSSAYTVTSSQLFIVRQHIEGFNTADLDFGTANAKTVTLSFWVRSSLTGTFGGSICNSAQNRFYPFSYTISSANTWEQKTVTIAGDTTGTWVGATNGIGLQVIFGFGVGSSLSASAGAWTASNGFSATGATSVVGTNGATFYITGVQLEQNTSATPFERRLYNQELANCQRYFEILTNDATNGFSLLSGTLLAPSSHWSNWIFKQTKRASPTVALATGNSWTAVTPSIFPSTSNVLFSGTNYFYNSGAANTTGLTASVEL